MQRIVNTVCVFVPIFVAICLRNALTKTKPNKNKTKIIIKSSKKKLNNKIENKE